MNSEMIICVNDFDNAVDSGLLYLAPFVGRFYEGNAVQI